MKLPTKHRRLQRKYAWSKLYHTTTDARAELKAAFERAIVQGTAKSGNSGEIAFRSQYFQEKYDACDAATKQIIEDYREKLFRERNGDFDLPDEEVEGGTSQMAAEGMTDASSAVATEEKLVNHVRW